MKPFDGGGLAIFVYLPLAQHRVCYETIYTLLARTYIGAHTIHTWWMGSICLLLIDYSVYSLFFFVMYRVHS